MTSVVVSVIALSSRAIRCRGREEGTTAQPPRPESGCGRLRMPCDPPSRPRLTAHGVCGRWQVFGLADLRAGAWLCSVADPVPTGRRFPPAWCEQCLMTAVVSAYRCGAVPDSHRVPSCPGDRLRGLRTSKRHHMRVVVLNPWHHMWGPRVASLGLPSCAAPPLPASGSHCSRWSSPAARPPLAATPRRRPAPRHTHGCRPACAPDDVDREATGGHRRPAQPDRGRARPAAVAGRRHRRQRPAARRPDRLGLR